MNDNVLGGIVESREYLVGIVALNQSACRADNGALTAADARDVVELLIERAADDGVEAAVVRADNGDILLLTGSYAAAAEDALVVVSDEVQRGVILLVLGRLTAELGLVYAFCISESGEYW